MLIFAVEVSSGPGRFTPVTGRAKPIFVAPTIDCGILLEFVLVFLLLFNFTRGRFVVFVVGVFLFDWVVSVFSETVL